MQTPDYRNDPRQTQVMMWLWYQLERVGIKLGPGRVSLQGRMYVERLLREDGDPAHEEIVAILRQAKKNGYEMHGDLHMIRALPAIQAAINEVMDEHEQETV